MDYYVGIDLGGTHLRAAVATESLEILGRIKTATPQNSINTEITEKLLQAVDRACEEADCDFADIIAAGIGSIGPFNHDAGTIEGPNNITGTEHPVALVEPLRERLGIETVTLINDAVCGVIAESEFAKQTPENMVYLTFSTGIGAGVIVDGRVLSGTNGNIAEVGHMTLDPTGVMRCGCGQDGHWEAYAGGANIPAYARMLSEEKSIETDLPVETEDVTTKEIFAALGDDPLADQVVNRIARWNTLGVANVVQAFAPSEIAIGGAIALNNRDAVLEPIRSNLADHVMVDVPKIRLAETGEDAVLYGALIAARDRVTDTE